MMKPINKSTNSRSPYLMIGLILGLSGLLWFITISFFTVIRYLANYSTTYDFGIFSQMFYYMDQIGLPLTTCERDGLLSHFAVHVSPFFYVLLPLYQLIPRPETLLVLQALAVISGLIPLTLIGIHHHLKKIHLVLIGFIYCIYPAFIMGCFYDFHENNFLTVILLFLLYFMDKKQHVRMLLMTILLLMVKEDAAVYAACAGLYLFFYYKNRKYGSIVFLTSCLYFGLALLFLNHYGTGAMINRYDNFISNPDYGLISMFKTFLVDPAYVFVQLLTKEKVRFVLQMLLPLGFLPFISSRWQRWILLIPFFLVNLLSDYPYQHSIFFQYIYGSGAFLFYLAVVNLSELKTKFRAWTPCYLLFSLLFGIYFLGAAIPMKNNYVEIYQTNREDIKTCDQLFLSIPNDASVSASTYFLPKLSLRKEVYMLDKRKTMRNTDYVVLDLKNGGDTTGFQDYYLKQGYQLTGYIEGYALLLQK